MQLTEVNTAAQIREFHRVPVNIYRDDPNWIPYIRQDIEKIFNPATNKLFQEGGKAIRWILKDDKGRLLGRVSAFLNPRTFGTGKLKTGGMGYFECINDFSAAKILFDACRDWLKAEGMEAMDGPVNFGDRNQFWGCQVSNWDEPAIYPMNYNPPYYSELFEKYGFGLYFKQFVYWRTVAEEAQPIFFRKYNQLKQDTNFSVRNISGMKLEDVAENFRQIYNSGWGGHSHFKELSSSAAQKLFKSMKPAIDPRIIIFTYYKDEPIAFYVNLPELNQIFRHVNGNMNLAGKIKFLYHKLMKTPTRMTGLVFGVKKEWQGKGVEATMVVHASETLRKHTQYKDTVLTWIGDFNPKMIKVVVNLGTTLWRTLHTYRYQFDRSLPFERAPIVE